MRVDVESLIADLLYEYDAVTIPALGGLTAYYKSAVVDQAGGKLHPPAKDFSFNNNLVVNDGLLIDQVQQRHGLSAHDADYEVSRFVDNLKARVLRGETVSLPRIGRFYVDGEKNVQFTPAATNFNTSSYGLPTVAFYPIAKGEETPSFTKNANIPVAPPEPAPIVPAKSETKSSSNWLLWVILVLAVLSLGVIFLSVRDIIFQPSPPTVTQDGQPWVPENDGDFPPENTTIEDNTSDDDNGASDGPTINPAQKSATIIVGSFKDAKNAQELIRFIYAQGYEAYSDQKDGLIRIGIRTPYDTQAELDKTYKEIKSNPSFKEAWIEQ